MNNQPHFSPLTISVDEALRTLSVGRTFFYSLVKAGDIRLIKVGSRSLVPCAELSRFVADRLNAGNKTGDVVTK